MQRSVLIENHFLPSLEYFCALKPYERIILEGHENFIKQSYRSRCYILAVGGRERVTVPLTAKHDKVLITEIRIDYSTRWQANFWRKVESAYTKAPFFEHYRDEFRREIFSNEPFIFNMNVRLLTMCLNWLKWNKELSQSRAYAKQTDVEIVDLRNEITAKTEYTARKYYHPTPYRQVFGNDFVPNLSVIDLVFCVGPRADAFIGIDSDEIGTNKT